MNRSRHDDNGMLSIVNVNPTQIFDKNDDSTDCRSHQTTHLYEIKSHPIKLNEIHLIWMSDKYFKYLFKPTNILSQQYEQLIYLT
ncbi:unnamed protein product [Rotaria sordida]|uniref:Uncharacterized protein n=1 Tax=Rotaria sordida TaxID=392033 RepID=A0A814UJZ9_9BILA|nr:unnamed protein product [Rotaria sordida]CAF4219674.1 unnamed protein product [Rotaria sordida]